ncbi:MAG: hypothetical protein KF905_14435 [Flavobacteriales bacterium]|nr:hypothetical protein [Flavobacteriales bacterium]
MNKVLHPINAASFVACIFLSLCTTANAQVHLSHVMLVDKSLELCDGKGNTLNIRPTHRTAPAGAKFSISDSIADDYIIRFWNWTNKDEVAAQKMIRKASDSLPPDDALKRAQSLTNNLHTELATGAELFFKLEKKALSVCTEPLYARFSPLVGASVLPFKLRPQTGEFTKDITLSGMGGVKIRPWRKNSFSIGALLGVGITSISLDSLNTEGRVTQPSDRSAITMSTGLVMQWERLQVGLFMGWDHLNKSDRRLWTHQGCHWLALGIGVSIFSEDKEAGRQKN